MNRRDALRVIGLALGTPVAPAVARAVLAGLTAPAGQALRTLTPEQGELLATLTELIIPATDTPGARAARVHLFIDSLLTDIFTGDERDHFLAGLADVDGRARAAAGAPFLASTPAQQVAVLQGMEQEAFKAAGDAPPPFFPWLKELTLVGYYTSEVGATQELKYAHVTGYYDGNVPYARIGRAYSYDHPS